MITILECSAKAPRLSTVASVEQFYTARAASIPARGIDACAMRKSQVVRSLPFRRHNLQLPTVPRSPGFLELRSPSAEGNDDAVFRLQLRFVDSRQPFPIATTFKNAGTRCSRSFHDRAREPI